MVFVLEKLAAMTHKHANLYTQTNLKVGVVTKTYYIVGLFFLFQMYVWWMKSK